MQSAPIPLSWIKKIDTLLPEAFEIPLFGRAPPFDWLALSSKLASRFETENFSIHPMEQGWSTGQQIKEDLKAKHFAAAIFFSPLKTPIYFALPKADQNKLAAWLMQEKTKSSIPEPLKDSFCRFLLLEVLEAASHLEPCSQFSPFLGEEEEIADEPAFCIDMEIISGNASCWGKLILPQSFRKEWVAHFSYPSRKKFLKDTAKTFEFPLHLTVGSVLLSQDEWNQLSLGDFLILDQGSYGREQIGLLSFAQEPLFHVKVRSQTIEILDYAFTPQDNMKKNASSSSHADHAEQNFDAVKDVPLPLVVEIASFDLSLEKLVQLVPGNVLELPSLPDQGVSLTVHGKKVARGELLLLGESLGVRILNLY